MPESTILPATEAEIDKVLTSLESQQPTVADDMKTVGQSDESPDITSVPQGFDSLSDASSLCIEPAPLTVSSASLPSPLVTIKLGRNCWGYPLLTSLMTKNVDFDVILCRNQ